MPIMTEALSKDEFERKERGERVVKSKPIPRPEPAFPKVPDLIKFNDISLSEFEKISSADMKRVKNEEGVNFIGYDVMIKLKTKTLRGWMIEGDYLKLSRQR